MPGFFDRRGLLRPPGAADEAELLSTCIKCARCVEVCPFQAIRLGPITAWRSYGTPFIDPIASPCRLCMRCPEICPTGALIPVAAEAAAMGTARLDRDRCYSYNGIVCNQCHRECPLREAAIVLDELLQPVVIEQACVGCGVCAHVCPSEPRSIEIKPRGRR
ncbi:MAG: 4Fe-4S dicluster domain-containing protein [Myxococcales bacterium]|nr:4Fe-4S dicluster domain-containing protein [Myxococcales bacterium]